MSFSKVGALVKKELLLQIRSFRFLISCCVFLLFGLGSPIIAKLTPELVKLAGSGEGVVIQIPDPTVRDAIIQYQKNVSQIVIFILIMLTMGDVTREKDRGTAAFVLVKPVSRVIFVAAKLLANWVNVFTGFVIAGVGCGLYTILLFQEIPILPFLGLNVFLLLYVLTIFRP